MFNTNVFINSILNWRGLTRPLNMINGEWLSEMRINKPRYYKRNQFMLHSMVAIGGGAIPQLKRALSYRRVGGSTQDKINYMAAYYDGSDKNFEFKVSFERLNKLLGVTKCLSLCPFNDTISHSRVNFNAIPGHFGSLSGLSNKAEAAQQDLFDFRLLYYSWVVNSHSKIKPNEVWSTAARPKLVNIDESLVKLIEGKPCCRAISVGSLLEQMIGSPLWIPLSMLFKKRFSETMCGIAIGINRIGHDWIRLGRSFNGSSSIYVGDYSRYDQTVPANVMERALDYMMSLFIDDEFTNNYIANFKEWFKDNIIRKTYNVDDVMKVDVSNGVPSGSVWTSLLNSICNIIVIAEACEHLHVDNYTPVVYGDDHLIIHYDEVKNSFREDFLHVVEDLFGIKGNPDDAKLIYPPSYYVTYKRPIYSTRHDLSKGTSKLRPIGFEYSDEPFPEGDHSKGTTHRWSYRFSGRVKFLQYYFLKSGKSIRPWDQTLNRLVNPERKVSTPSEHEVCLISHLIDNYNNAHVRNWIYHLLYDNCFMKKMFDYKRNELMPQAQLYYYKRAQQHHSKSPGTPGTRAWYRKVDHYVNLQEHESMVNFNYKWSAITKLCEEVQDVDLDVPFYALQDIMRDLISKGLTPKHVAYANAKGSHNFKSFISEHERLVVEGKVETNLERMFKERTWFNRRAGVDTFIYSLVLRCLPYCSQIALKLMKHVYDNPIERVNVLRRQIYGIRPYAYVNERYTFKGWPSLNRSELESGFLNLISEFQFCGKVFKWYFNKIKPPEI